MKNPELEISLYKTSFSYKNLLAKDYFAQEIHIFCPKEINDINGTENVMLIS